MISIILPVLNQIQFTDNCLKSLAENIIQPPEIILIDNASTDPIRDLIDKHRSLNIRYFRNDKNIGVNLSWSLGVVLTNQPYVLFLNNDTYTNKFFIKKILKTMEDPSVGICIPKREGTIPKTILDNKDDEPIIEDAKFIEGWAFTLRREIHDYIGQIPPEFETYMGDTYYFECSKWMGYKNVQMMNNSVYHYGSLTVNHQTPRDDIIMKHRIENTIWRKMMNDVKYRVQSIKK